MIPVPPKVLQKVRIQTLRIDVAALHHARIFRVVAMVLASIYAFRVLLAFAISDARAASVLALATFFHGALFVLGKQGDRVKVLSLLVVSAILIVEALLVAMGSAHFIQFFLAIPVAIVFSALMIGMLPATLVAAAATALSLMMIEQAYSLPQLRAEAAWSEAFRYGLFIHLLGSLGLLVLIIYQFQNILAKSEEDVQRRRVDEARSTRRLALAETLGKAAHELNNPLAILDGAYRRLKLYQLHEDEARQTHNLKHMQDSVFRLRDVLESIRVFVEGDLEEPCEPVPLEDLLRSFQQASREKLLSFGVSLRIENPLRSERIHCRPRQILYVLQVFLDNAVEAMEGSDKLLRLIVHDHANSLILAMEDTGPGIPEADAEKIFTPFFSTKSVGKSMGMNLSISRVLVQEQGGQIGFENLPLRGARFFIELPKAGAKSKATRELNAW